MSPPPKKKNDKQELDKDFGKDVPGLFKTPEAGEFKENWRKSKKFKMAGMSLGSDESRSHCRHQLKAAPENNMSLKEFWQRNDMVNFASQKDTSNFNVEITGDREIRQDVIVIINMRHYRAFTWGSSCKNGDVEILRSLYDRELIGCQCEESRMVPGCQPQ